MKVSLNWIKEYTSVKVSIDDLVQKIGAQLGEVEEVTDLGKRYEGIVVAKVVTCEKHPNADKLHVCTIDDGGAAKHVTRNAKGHVQVVCGAPNVAVGLHVAWLPPGVTVPSTVEKDPFVLEAREIRGEMSNGMLASASELDISDDHSGIVTLESTIKPGTSFAQAVGFDDYIIDIENKMFTHRPDLFGELGLAREIAGIQHQKFESPNWYRKAVTEQRQGKKLSLKVKNELPALSPRFMAVAVSDVTVKPSPVWLQAYLSRVGIRPINNIVDVTNYIMMLTGQPLHAYDHDRLCEQDGTSAATLVVRHPAKGEELKLLNGKTITPRREAIMIASAKKLVGVGGVIGGADTEVSETTKNIVIECASFDMYSVRKTSMEHGIFTDAVTRFNKGQSSKQNDVVLAHAVEMILDLCPDAGIAGSYHDLKSAKAQDNATKGVTVSSDFVNERLGSKLSLKEMATLLENVEFKIVSVPADKTRLHVIPPFWRTDIEIPEDVVEEIGRLYGYDKLPLLLPTRGIEPAPHNSLLDFQNTLRTLLARAGANEVLTYTFVHGNLFEKVGQDPQNAYQLSNALSPELQYYRQSLAPSLLDKVHSNLKSDIVRGDDNEFVIFEINPVFGKDLKDKDRLPVEDLRLAVVFAADEKTYTRKYEGAAYYMARHYADSLFDFLGISTKYKPATEHHPDQPISRAAIAPFDVDRAAIITSTTDEFLGEIGEFSAPTRRAFKLPPATAGFELDVRQLMRVAAQNPGYTPLSRFPKVVQDITLRVKNEVSYQELHSTVQAALHDLVQDSMMVVVGEPRIYRSEEDTHHKHVTFRLWVSDSTRTLKAEVVNSLLDSVATASESLGAERV